MKVFGLPWDFIIILLALATIPPWRGVVRTRALFARSSITSSDRMGIYASTIAAQWIAVGLTAWRCAARGLSARNLGLSLAHPAATIALGAALAVLFAFVQLLGFRALSKIPAERRGRVYELACKISPQRTSEILAFIALVATVGFCEEFLFRGFVFAVFRQLLLASAPAAILASSALFALGHLYQGRRGIVVTFFLGVIFALTRTFTASLLPPIMGHCAVDLMAGLAAPKSKLQ
jgi:membrane protease YdiL (CAAX protease family)